MAWLAALALSVSMGGNASAQYGPAPAPPPPEHTPPRVETQAPTAPLTIAPDPTEADLERARALFAEGLDFVAQEDWVSAEERFTQVHAIRSSPVVSYNLASALTHLGRLVESSKLLTQVLSDPQADDETRRAAQLLQAKIEPNIGTLAIRVYGSAEGCSFTLDEQPIDLSVGALSLRVDTGVHRVAVVRDGATILSPQVTLGGAFPMQAQLSLEIPPKVQPLDVARAAPVPAPAPAAQPRPQPDLRISQSIDTPRDDGGSVLEEWWLWAGAGAVVAAGVVTALVLTSSADEPTPISGDPVIRARVLP